MINSLAFITARKGLREQLLAAWKENAPKVRAEAGCLEYTATIDVEDAGPFQAAMGPDTFVIIEKWADLASLQAHVAAPHMKEYAERVGSLVASRRIHVTERLPERSL